MAKVSLGGMMKNSKTRLLIIIGAAILVVIVGFLISVGGDDPLQEQQSRTTSIPRNIDVTPGGELPERYRDLQVEENIRRAEQAEKSGRSAIPTLIGDVKKYDFELPQFTEPSIADTVKTIAKTETTKKEPEDPKSLDKLLNPNQQAQQAKQQQKRQNIQPAAISAVDSKLLEKRIGEMEGQLKSIFQAWNFSTNQDYVPGTYAEEDNKLFAPVKTSSDIGGSGGTGSGNTGGNAGGSGGASGGYSIKAGSVIFAVLDTSVNTDEPGPILATIVQGKLKGAKLVGTVQAPNNQFSQKVVLRFNTISVPSLDSSISIEAVAIDPHTARTALASDVNNHYLLRYGSLFASSFLEGYGEAIGNAGTTTRSPDGSTSTTKEELSGSEEIFSAFGTVGQRLGENIGNLFNRPPTIFVDQGVGFGLLFTSDANIPLGNEDF